jgi:thiamine biosynthesis lipoprotein
MATGKPVVSHAEPVMGTVVSFAVLPGARHGNATTGAIDAACAVLHRADAIFSTWDPQSPVSRLREGTATLGEMPSAVAEVLDLCENARRVSGGWFDPWAMPAGVDPTGLVKGWAVERALAVLHEAGMEAAMVNGGGDIAVFGAPARGQAWRVGIRHPWRAGALAAILEVSAAVATSGSYERAPHLLDPFTGQLASRAVSATITAMAVGGDEVLGIVAGLDGYAGYLIRADGSEAHTSRITFAG